MRNIKRKRSWQSSRLYLFVRGRQLEGTLSQSSKVGIYGINANRILAGWGIVSEKRWPYPKSGDKWPPDEPPGLDVIAKFNRIFAYYRVRNLDDARICLANHSPFSFTVPIHDGWQKAPQGMISLPISGHTFTENHCVIAVGYDNDKQHLKFANSWGVGWGDKGYGSLPYEYFTRYFQDAWLLNPPFISAQMKEASKSNEKCFMYGCVDWVHRNPLGNNCTLHDLFDLADSTRIGWCFATFRDGNLDVEEFFIRPEFRGKNHSSKLMSRLLCDAKSNNVPLRFWIPYCDVYARTANILAFNHILKKHNFIAKKSGVSWAMFKAERRSGSKAFKNAICPKSSKPTLAPPGGMLELDLVLSEIKPIKN